MSMLRFLLLESSPIDAEPTLAVLSQGQVKCSIVWTKDRAEFVKAIESNCFDLILSEFSLPDWEGLAALEMAQAHCPKVPFIFVAELSEAIAIDILKQGATDYVLKSQLGRLVPSIERALREAQATLRDRLNAEAALHLSEHCYRLLSDAVPHLMWMNDANGKTEYLNQRWQAYTGLPVAAGLDFKWRELVYPEDLPQLISIREQRIQAGNPYEVECRVKRFDQSYRWHLLRVVPLKDYQGEVLCWYGTATDIHDMKQFALEKAQLYQQAQEANRIKDEFLAVLSHELRTPLNPILGWAKLLRSKSLDRATVDRAIETIERNAKIQTQLIEDLLDVSHIQRGKLNLCAQQVDLVQTLKAAIAAIQLAADAKAIQIDTLGELQQTHEAQGWQVLGDADRLRQIFWNLLSNALKFTPAGGQITVHLSLVQPPLQAGSLQVRQPLTIDRYAQITVQDTGKGIPPDFLPYVFDSFRQADGGITRSFGGLGMGLAIVHHLVELHGGSITAASLGEGQGSTFTVSLPLLKQKATQPAGQRCSTQPSSNC